MSRSRRPAPSLALIALAMVAACGRSDDPPAATEGMAVLPSLPATLPLAAGAATALGVAPPASALPAAAPIRAVRVAQPAEAYAYAEAASGYAEALGEAPPDYGFDYGGVQPWAWQGYDDSVSFAEPVEYGYRYYYYRPGADAPYFVRDPDYGYGYDDGRLAAVYAGDGGLLPFADYGPRQAYAARYLTRGRDLYAASRRQPRRAVAAANWAARRSAMVQSRRAGASARAHQPDWAAYHDRNRAQQDRHWRAETARRAAAPRGYAGGARDTVRAPAQPRAVPVALPDRRVRDERRPGAPAAIARRKAAFPEPVPIVAVHRGRPDRREERADRVERERDVSVRRGVERREQPAQVAARGERERGGRALRERSEEIQRRDRDEGERVAARAQRAAEGQARRDVELSTERRRDAAPVPARAERDIPRQQERQGRREARDAAPAERRPARAERDMPNRQEARREARAPRPQAPAPAPAPRAEPRQERREAPRVQRPERGTARPARQ